MTVFDAAPCKGAPLYLLFPTVTSTVKDDNGDDVEIEVDDIDAPAPDFCLSCPISLPCLEKGWTEKFGCWGGFNYAERQTARFNKQSPEELWLTKFPSPTTSDPESGEDGALAPASPWQPARSSA